CLATNEIAQTGLSSLPPVIYYSEQLFRMKGLLEENQSSLFSRFSFFPIFELIVSGRYCTSGTGFIFIPSLSLPYLEV
ncbi:hypothetical protein, partial [Aeromonas salmonicida]|uniref:hypothetical protein n=1 Tax=Aeromonas salmonicida TaxID=645 RepID=UPI0031D2B07C